MSVKAMKAALEVLESIGLKTEKMQNAIDLLRLALAQPDLAKVGEVGIWGEENLHDHVDTVTKSTNPMQNPHKHKENT